MRKRPANYVVHVELRLCFFSIVVVVVASFASRTTANVFAERKEKNQFFSSQPDYLIGNKVNTPDMPDALRLFYGVSGCLRLNFLLLCRNAENTWSR